MLKKKEYFFHIGICLSQFPGTFVRSIFQSRVQELGRLLKLFSAGVSLRLSCMEFLKLSSGFDFCPQAERKVEILPLKETLEATSASLCHRLPLFLFNDQYGIIPRTSNGFAAPYFLFCADVGFHNNVSVIHHEIPIFFFDNNKIR